MKKTKRALAWFLCFTTILGMTACSSGSTGGDSSSTSETVDNQIENPVNGSDISIDVADDKTEPTNDHKIVKPNVSDFSDNKTEPSNDHKIVKPNVSDISIDATNNKVEPAKLTYVGSYNILTASDIKPAYKYFKANYNCEIEVKIVAYNNFEQEIVMMINSGQSPDLVDKQDYTYPYWCSKNLYEPLDEYMNLDTPQWAGLESYINSYKWNGNNYYYPFSYEVNPSFLIYNRGVFKSEGIDDPKELYDNGEWDWNSFKKCMDDFMAKDKTRTGLYGYLETAFIDSTGTPLMGVDENGKLVNNMRSAGVERAQQFMEQLRKEGVSKYYDEYIDVNTEPILHANTAFQSMGSWFISEYAKIQEKDNSLDIFFVPFPRDPSADKHYMSISTFGFLVPNGSKYVEQACVFIDCCRLSITDEALAATSKESIMKNKKYTDEMYDFLMDFKNIDKFNCIIDEPYGFGDETTKVVRTFFTDVAFEHDKPVTWTQLREQHFGSVQNQIDYFNSLIN